NQSQATKSAVAAFLPVAAGRAALRLSGELALQILGTLWLAVSLFLAIRLILGFEAMRRTLRTASPCDDAFLLGAAEEAARRTGVSCPLVLFNSVVETPTIYAFGRPRLLVPYHVEASLRDAKVSGNCSQRSGNPALDNNDSHLGETRRRDAAWPRVD